MNPIFFAVKSHCRVLLIAAASFAVALPVCAQANSAATPNPGTKTPAFEVASVKPSKPGCTGMSASSSAGRFSAQCTTLMGLLYNAYPIKPNTPVPGLPGWGNSAQFYVDAKTDDETTLALKKLSEDEQWTETQQMLQALLADRFKLRIHHEVTELPVYDLVIAKSGFKLKEVHEVEGPQSDSWTRGHISMRPDSVSQLAFTLSEMLDCEVVDKTGLTGKYNIDLKWTPDDQQGTPDAGPTVFTALEEQLGLKLAASKSPVDTIVIDHVEKPTEN